jgi:hypothetical protein
MDNAAEFGKDHGLLHEVVVTGRKVGAGQEFWSALAHREDLFARVVAFVVEALRVVFTLVAKIERNMDGWTCVQPVDAEPGEFEPELREFLEPGEDRVGGEEMVKRAVNKGALAGLRQAEAMLRQQEKIPVEWRQFCLVFAEVWLDPNRSRDVWCLYWDGERWSLRYYWLGHDFGSSDRLVLPRKCKKSLDS